MNNPLFIDKKGSFTDCYIRELKRFGFARQKFFWVSDGVALSLKFFPHNHVDLSLGPQDSHKSQIWRCTSVSSEQVHHGVKRSSRAVWPVWIPELQGLWETESQKPRFIATEEDICHLLLASEYTGKHIHTWAHTCSHTRAQAEESFNRALRPRVNRWGPLFRLLPISVLSALELCPLRILQPRIKAYSAASIEDGSRLSKINYC